MHFSLLLQASQTYAVSLAEQLYFKAIILILYFQTDLLPIVQASKPC